MWELKSAFDEIKKHEQQQQKTTNLKESWKGHMGGFGGRKSSKDVL